MAHEAHKTLSAADLMSRGLTWLTHREHGNRNFEQSQVDDALADGWVPAQASVPTPRPAVSSPTTGVVAMTHPDPKFGNRGVAASEVEKFLAQGYEVIA